MRELVGFKKGVDLGGWLSQCDYSKERLDHFVEEQDIAKVASWGVDHVRLPFDFNIVQAEDDSFIEDGFERIAKAIGWAKKYGLKNVLDLHKTKGFSFDEGEKESGFFDSEKLQNGFYALWEEMAKRFGNDPENVAFELLNEITDQSFIDGWNRISTECIKRIRQYAPKVLILVGSYWNNAPEAVKDLAAPADENVIFNMHCYDPLKFTHQGATWTSQIVQEERYSFEEIGIDANYFKERFASAVETANKYNTALYCGEYGVIDRATPEDTVKWYKAIHEAFEELGIGRSAWNYKEMDFGLSDARMSGVIEELIKYL